MSTLDALTVRRFAGAVNTNTQQTMGAGAQWVQATVANLNDDGTANVVLAGSSTPVTAQVLTQAQGTISAGQVVEVRRQNGYAVVHGAVDAPPAATPTPETVVAPGVVLNELNGITPTAPPLAKVNSISPSYVTGGVHVTFAQPFPNACADVLVSIDGMFFPVVSAITKTGFTIKFYVPTMPSTTTAGTPITSVEATSGATIPFTYLAIGS